MKNLFARSIAFTMFGASLMLGGCASEAPQATSTEPVEATDQTDNALTILASTSRPALADGRVVEAWHTSIGSQGTFRVRGVDLSGAVLAEYAFTPGSGAVTIEAITPERGTLRIVDGVLTETFNLSESAQRLFDGMSADFAALEAPATATGLAPKGWWACTKASGWVAYHCGSLAWKAKDCVKNVSLSCVDALGASASCVDAAKKWKKECL